MMCYVVLEVLWGSAALTKSLFITEIKLRLILLDSLLQGFRLTRQQLWPIGGGPRDYVTPVIHLLLLCPQGTYYGTYHWTNSPL